MWLTLLVRLISTSASLPSRPGGSNLGREGFANGPGELQQCTAPKRVMDCRDGPLITEQAPAMKFCAAAREYNR